MADQAGRGRQLVADGVDSSHELARVRQFGIKLRCSTRCRRCRRADVARRRRATE